MFALTDQGKDLELALDGSKLIARAAFGGAPVTVTQTADLTLSQWHHVALTAGAGKLTLYVDGIAVGSAPVTLQEIGGTFTIGASGGGHFLTGDIDEVEVAKVARSADWIKAAARSQGMDANLVVYGADGQKEGGGQTSYFVTIAKNLTVDGWVVIGICMAMLAIALIIMVVKAIFLSRVEKANGKFLREFRRLSGDATALDSPTGEWRGRLRRRCAVDGRARRRSEQVRGLDAVSAVPSRRARAAQARGRARPSARSARRCCRRSPSTPSAPPWTPP